MHARVQGCPYRERKVSSVQECPYRERGSTRVIKTFCESECDSLNVILPSPLLSSLKHPQHMVRVIPVQPNALCSLCV